MKALKNKYKSRKLFKRSRRTLWILRVNANARLHGTNYNNFICRLKEANINLNRKILSQLGIYDRGVFTSVMDVAIPWWRKLLKRKNAVPPKRTLEQIDAVAIPYLEQTFPELYTDATIRFNRKVKDDWVEYTVDTGDPEMWREMLPKMPELANFNLPDHFIQNANAEFEDLPLELVPIKEGYESKDYLKFMEKVEREQALDKEKEARGEPTWPKKEGVSRKDWFSEEQQSWF